MSIISEGILTRVNERNSLIKRVKLEKEIWNELETYIEFIEAKEDLNSSIATRDFIISSALEYVFKNDSEFMKFKKINKEGVSYCDASCYGEEEEHDGPQELDEDIIDMKF